MRTGLYTKVLLQFTSSVVMAALLAVKAVASENSVPVYQLAAGNAVGGGFSSRSVSIGAQPGSFWTIVYFGGSKFNIRAVDGAGGTLSPINLHGATYSQPTASELDILAVLEPTECGCGGYLAFSSSSPTVEFSITVDGEPAMISYYAPAGQTWANPDGLGFGLSLESTPTSLPILFDKIFSDGFDAM